MKQKLTLLLIALFTTVGAWAEDYSQGYYTISPGANTSYQGFYSASNANSKYGGSSSKSTALAYFTFEKTGQENVYYWYDCSNKKYIYADGSGYLQVADTKNTNDNNYKWFIKDDGAGNLTITDMTNYNGGNPTKGLIQLNSVGGWWASKWTLSSNTGRNTWKFNLLMKKNVPYYIGLQRAADRYLQYGSNKMQQAQVSTKSVEHIWYFTDEGTGSTKIYALSNITAMGYAADATAGADKIATTNSVKNFYIKSTNATDYPFAFLTDAQSSTLYLSNHGGTSSANMGLYSDIIDSGTRLKVEDATDFFAQNQTVNLITSNIITPYSGGAGTSEARVSITHNGGTITLTGAEKTYYLTGSNNATQSTVNFDGTTINYDNELGVGTATYNINNTSITTPRFITSQGGAGRPSVVNLTGNSVITVTGNSNVDTNQSSIMIGHWNGSSDVTLSGTSQIAAADAQFLIGKTGNTQTITLNDNSNITAKGIIASANASGTNTLNLNGGSLNLGEVGITSFSTSRSIAINVTENATITATAATLPISQPITVASGKVLNIDGTNNAVTLSGTVTNNGTINFKNATLTANLDDRSLEDYTFTSCTATLQFTETGTEYAAGGFTITNIPAGVTIKVKKYGASDYETVTPEAGTATISHEVGVSGLAAWLDYTFNESTKATNIHSPADQVITNAGNAGSGNNLTIDGSYTTATSYNDDGTLKVMSTPWRNITWPTNYTVAVAGNVPDVENGCLVAFGSSTNGSQNYLAIIRGASQNEIKLVKGHGQNSAFEVISTMTAANATALSHLVVFTKNGNTFTVYLDGVQKTQVTYSETLGGGFQIGSIHGGITGTGVGRVNDMSDATAKAKVFAKAIRVYDYVISSDQMEALTEEFPYTSFGGKYSRTITENSNLSATDAWLNTSTQGNVDVPENATVEAVTYYPDVEITTTAASTLTVNADMDAENIKFEGAGKLTIASDGEHNIHIYGSLTANGPISVKYGETDLSAVPVTIGESGSVEFDFSASASAFSDVTTSTDYSVTGNTADYGSKVTGVYPSDIYHTYSLAYNNSTSSYCLTVEPSALYLNQLQAIALVKPYYDGNLVGASLGRYTIKLGETSYANFADFGTEVMSWETIGDCVEPTITLNTPSAGFYRLKNVATNEYLTAISGPYGYTSTTRGVYANGDANSAATVIRLYDKNGDGKLYMYNQGNGFGWTDANKQDGSGAVGYLSTNPDKYVNWFPGTASGQIGFAICYGNGTGSYASYLETGIYTVDTDDESVIAGTNPRADAAQWIFEEATSVTVTMHSDGAEPATYYATFCAPFSYTVSDATAYRLAKSENVLTPTAVDGAVPAGTPVLLQGTSSTATLTISGTDYATSPLSSDLTGTYTAIANFDGSTNYVLGTDDTKVGFFHWKGTTLNANRAYVAGSGGEVKGFVLNFDDDETGIEGVQEVQEVQGAIYNLAGQRISKMQKGINIMNGKKVLK